MEIRESLEAIIDAAIDAARADGSLELAEAPQAALERPRDEANGDWASTVAMRTAKLAHKNPREIAQIIVDHIPANDMIAAVEIAGPGFINIRLSDAVLQGVVREVREEGDNFGRGTIPEGERYVNLEYVSANPTGPFHVGHGRWASLGDAMARVMRHGGYDVYEEYYINDHGNQMDVFGNSVNVRYQQLLGRDVEMPEACYGGAYVKDIAQDIIDRDGDKWLNVSDEEREQVIDYLASEITDYLTSVNALQLPPSVSHYMGCVFHVINDLEQIGDHAIKILVQTEKCVELGQGYSDAAQEELRVVYQLDMELLVTTMEMFHRQQITAEDWMGLKLKERTIMKLVAKAQTNHMVRLREKTCTFEQGLTFVESLNSFTRVVNHVMNIAEASNGETLLVANRE